MTALSAARQLDDAIQRARSTAARLGDGAPPDVAAWNRTDLDAAKAADAEAYLNSYEARDVARYVMQQYGTREGVAVGTFQVQESIRNARTGASELVTHEFPLHLDMLDPARASLTGQPIHHLSFAEFLELRDVDRANSVLTTLASRVTSPRLDARRALHASFVRLVPREKIRDGVDVYAGRALLQVQDRAGQRYQLPAGRPFREDLLPRRPVAGERDPNVATVERITRSSPILANVHDRYGETTDLWRSSSVVLDTRAAARSLDPAGRH